MQDNYKPSKEFTDQSWLAMQEILDREMPLVAPPAKKGKKRRLGLFWLFGIMTLAAGLWLLSNNFNDYNSEISHLEIAIVGEKNNSSNTNNSQSNNSNSSESGTIIQAGEVANENVNIVNSLVAKAKGNSTSNAASSKSYIPAKTAKPYSNLLPQSKEIKDEVKLPSKVTPPAFLMVEEEEKEQRVPIAATDFLPEVPLSLLAKEDEIIKHREIKSSPLETAFFLRGGTRVYNFSDWNNYSAGAELRLNKKGSKFGLRAGLNFSTQRSFFVASDVSLNRSTELGELVDEDISNGLQLSGGTTSEAVYLALISRTISEYRFYSLEAALGLDYKFSKRWSVYGGVRSNFILFSNHTNIGGLRADAVIPEILSSPNPESEFSFSNVSSIAPRRLDYGAEIGVSFMATDRLSLGLKYYQGLGDTYPDFTEIQRNNFLELGLGWRLF